MVKFITRLKNNLEKVIDITEEEKAAEEKVSEEVKILTEIRDILKK
jgi:large-conductance mechanosensitive channel